MARAKVAKVQIEERMKNVQIALSATVNLGDGFFGKVHYGMEFEILPGDNVDDLTDQAWKKADEEIEMQIEEILENNKTEKKSKK